MASTEFSLTLVALLGAIIVVQWLVIWSIRRHRDPDLDIECDLSIDELLPSLAGLSLGTVVDGNSVEIFENGAYFDVLVDDIRAARRPCTSRPFCGRKASSGSASRTRCRSARAPASQVRVLLDATGSKNMGEAASSR